MKIRFPKNALAINWPVKRLPVGNFLFPLGYTAIFSYLKGLVINQRIILLIFKNNLFPKRSIIAPGLYLEPLPYTWLSMESDDLFPTATSGKEQTDGCCTHFPSYFEIHAETFKSQAFQLP